MQHFQGCVNGFMNKYYNIEEDTVAVVVQIENIFVTILIS
jgi:hypothetical protein